MERHSAGVTDVSVLEPVFDLALSTDLAAAGTGTAMLFGGVIETLADTFTVDDRKALEQVLARVITRVRSLPPGRVRSTSDSPDGVSLMNARLCGASTAFRRSGTCRPFSPPTCPRCSCSRASPLALTSS